MTSLLNMIGLVFCATGAALLLASTLPSLRRSHGFPAIGFVCLFIGFSLQIASGFPPFRLAKDTVTVLAALLTPVVAMAAVGIGFLQWHLSRSRFRQELFDRRYRIFDEVRRFLQVCAKDPCASEEDRLRFLREAKGAGFLFSLEIEKFVNQAHDRAVDLETYHQEAQAGNTAEHARERAETKKWFLSELRTVDDRFRNWLVIQEW